jgi:hypothetical protein
MIGFVFTPTPTKHLSTTGMLFRDTQDTAGVLATIADSRGCAIITQDSFIVESTTTCFATKEGGIMGKRGMARFTMLVGKDCHGKAKW